MSFLKHMLLPLALTAALIAGGFAIYMNADSTHRVSTPYFRAEMHDAIWILTLDHLSPSVQSVRVQFNGTLHGIYLPNDKIYLPVLDKPAKLRLTYLDHNSKEIRTNVFVLKK